MVDILLDECDLETVAGIRDHALICVLWDTWIRRCEAAGAEETYLELDEQEITVYVSKLEEWQLKMLDKTSLETIKRWLETRAGVMQRNGKKHNALFINIFNGDPLTPEGISGVFKRLQTKVGFRVSPHDFRRGGISDHAGRKGNSVTGMLQAGLRDPRQYHHYAQYADMQTLKDRRNHDD